MIIYIKGLVRLPVIMLQDYEKTEGDSVEILYKTVRTNTNF